MLFFWTFYLSKSPEKGISISTKILSSTTVLKTDNKNDDYITMSIKSAY